MEPKLTHEQESQIATWVSARDFLLHDIGAKQTESDNLTQKNKEIAASNTEIADKIQQSIGRFSELEKKEEEMARLTTVENARLTAEKSKLQTEVSSLESEVNVLTETKKNLHDDITSITKIHEAVFARTSDIERIVGETVKITSSNASEVKNILVEAGNELQRVIDVGNKNVEITNKVISEIPKIIVDLHKDVLERRKFNRIKI